MKGIALINGRNFAHQDIIFNIAGVPITSLSNISLEEGAQREFSYGTQELPVGYGEGRDEPVAVTFEISMADATALRRAIPNGDLKRLAPFNIPITFANPSNPAGVTVRNVLIQKASLASDTENKDIKVPITAIASDLKWK